MVVLINEIVLQYFSVKVLKSFTVRLVHNNEKSEHGVTGIAVLLILDNVAMILLYCDI